MKHLPALAVILAAGCGSDGPTGSPPTLGTMPKTWEYVAVPGTKCMNGTPTGMGVNLGTSGDLVIYMEGGGACFNNGTCNSVAHPSGWGAADFESNIGIYNVGIFDRLADKNPLKDATFVFIPYCTGPTASVTAPRSASTVST